METLLITPSHGPDLERCRRLVRSADRYLTGIDRHIVLVDGRSASDFASIRSDRVELVTQESILPWWIRRAPLATRWWLSLAGLPVRGWILQQVVKLAIAERYDADVLLFADSDMVFVRPFDARCLVQDDHVRLFRMPRGPVMRTDRRYRNWFRHAAKIAGLPSGDAIDYGYIAQLNTLRRDHVLAMHRRIEALATGGWMSQLLHWTDFSEFILYGAFVEYGLRGAGHFVDERQLCHSSWFHDLDSPRAMEHFAASIGPDQVALHLQSNLGMPARMIDRLVERAIG